MKEGAAVKKKIYIPLVLVFVLVAYFYLVSRDHKISIQVEVNPSIRMSQYTDAYIDVQNIKYETIGERREGWRTFFVKQNIESNLEPMRIKCHSYDNLGQQPRATDMLVNSNISYGWGIPRLSRHFEILSRYLQSIDIEFLDAQKKTWIAKITYRSTGPVISHAQDIEKMFNELKAKLIESGSWKAPQDKNG